jgi:hypothetical protein
MSENSQGERCLCPVEGKELGQCGKPAIGKAAVLNPVFTPPYPIPVCQEHLAESQHGAAGTDID